MPLEAAIDPAGVSGPASMSMAGRHNTVTVGGLRFARKSAAPKLLSFDFPSNSEELFAGPDAKYPMVIFDRRTRWIHGKCA